MTTIRNGESINGYSRASGFETKISVKKSVQEKWTLLASAFSTFTNWLRQRWSSEPSTLKEADSVMKFLIVGLGNPGPKYANTRHNIGFRVVDELAGGAAHFTGDSHGAICRIKHRGKQLILLKPDTFMNLSGKAVRHWLQKEKIDKQRLLVVVDDLHLDFGKLRLRGKGSAAGHNGLKSIDELTGGNNYARLRCGIGKDFHPGQQADYVLSEWNREESAGMSDFIKLAAEACQSFCAHGLGNTMSQFNNK